MPVPSSTQVPRWLDRAGAFAWRIAVLIGLGAVLTVLAFILGTVTASVIVALIVAATFVPLGRSLRERGWSGTASAAAVTGAAVVVGGLLLFLLALAFVPYIPGLIENVQSGLETLQQWVAASGSPELAEDLEDAGDSAIAWLSENVAVLIGSVANVVTIALLALFLTFFLLQDGEKGWGRAMQVTDGWRRERIDEAGHQALSRVGGYLRGTAVLSAIVAVTDLAYMMILGVPLAAPLAVLAFLGGFIPYVGGLLATTAIVLTTWGSVSGQAAIIIILLISVTRLVVSNILRPMIYGSRVGLHPGVILLVLPAGAAFAGILGVFAAVPIAVFVASITASVIAALGPSTDEEHPAGIPLWLDRLAQWGWRLLAVLAVVLAAVLIVGQVPLVAAPLLIATILAASIVPLVGALRRRGWSSQRAALVATGGSVLAILLILVLAVVSLGPGLAQAVAAGDFGADEASEATGGALSWLSSATAEVGTNVLGAVAGILQALSAFGVVLILSALLTFYLLRDGRKGWDRITETMHPWQRDQLQTTVSESIGVLGGYMGGTAVISAVGAASQLAIMLLLGLPYAIPVAILSFFACFIPYVGGFVTTGLAFLIAVAYGDVATIVIMGIYTIVFNIVQGNVVTPLVYRRAVNLHPAVILLAIPAGGALAGIIGMFLAVPVLALFATIRLPVMRLLAGEPVVPVQPATSGAAPEAG